MLVVTAEIWPGGDPVHKIEIGTITAANISNLAEVSNYEVSICQTGSPESGTPRWQDEFILAAHDRGAGVWDLVRRITEQARDRREGRRDASA